MMMGVDQPWKNHVGGCIKSIKRGRWTVSGRDQLQDDATLHQDAAACVCGMNGKRIFYPEFLHVSLSAKKTAPETGRFYLTANGL